MPPDRLAILLLPMLLVDVPRYAVGLLMVCGVDFVRDIWRRVQGDNSEERPFDHCPPITLIIAGLNEGDTIGQTLESIWGTYPKMEVIVVDDGSSDGMADVAQEFARLHPEVTVLRKPQRGGKSSALNFALPFAKTEILVCVDGDSHLGPNAIWEIVQPFADETVGAVSGTVIARNPFVNLVTWLQAAEYLRCIFLGRLLLARLDIMGVISGAFGAFRKSAIERVKGWDVGPGEDGDLTLRLRKMGYRIAFRQYAQCFTNLPKSLWRLIKQRRRWEWAAVTFECRKHVDLANVLSPNFRLTNLGVLLDRWVYNILTVYTMWAYGLWLLFHPHEHLWKQFLTYYVAYVILDFLLSLIVMYYSLDRRRDFIVCLCAPLMPFYLVLLKAVALVSVTEEILMRKSFQDGFVPEHVRRTTWHW